MKYIIALLLLGLFFIPLSSAEENNVCVFGHRVVTSSQTTYNDSNFLQGYNWNNAPYPFLGSCPDGNVVMNVTNGGLQCVPLGAASTDYTYINNNILRNKTDLYNNITSLPSSGGNASWNESYANTRYIRLTNTSVNSAINDLTANRTNFLTTYNLTYDTFWTSNSSIWSAINSKIDNTVSNLVNYFTKTEINSIVINNKTVAMQNITGIPSCTATQVLTNRSGFITCVEDTAGSGVSYNATYDATSQDVTANRTAWFSTYNSSYDAKISMDYTYVNLNIDANLTSAKAFTMAQYNGNNSLWLSTFNSTYANALNSSFNETRTNNLYVGLNNATLNTALNTYQSTSNTTSSYVPYVGANKNVNITSFNYSRTLFNVYDNGSCGIIRLGGTLFVGC